MDSGSSDNLMRLFDEFADMPPGIQREELIRQRCLGNDDLITRLNTLLDADVDNTRNGSNGLISKDFVEIGADESIPLRIGGHEVVRLVGHGGMAMVFETIHNSTGARQAVKLIRTFILSLRTRERLKLEAESLALLDHEGIARFGDAGVAEVVYASGVRIRTPFVAMEFVEGVPIDSYVAQTNPSFEDRIRLIVQTLRALQHAHQQGVIHRDIKPSNVLVTKEGRCKIVDFGVARLLDDEDRSLTQTGQVLGTVRYMSPEQAMGESNAADIRTDIYSAGAILYELLSGQRFVDVHSVGTSFQNALHSTKRLSQVKPGVSRDLDAILGTALDPKRERRYASAGNFADDLERYLAGETVTARVPTRIEHAFRMIRRNKVAAFSIAVALVAVVGGLAVSIQQARIAQRRADEARQESIRRAAALEAERASTAFLSEILVAVDPEFDGQSARLLDVTLRAVDAIPLRFADQPLSAAVLQASLGRTLVSLGQHKKGLTLITDAYETRKSLLGAAHPDTVDANFDRAEAAISIGNDQFLTEVRPAIDAYVKAHPNDMQKRARADLANAVLASHFDQYSSAIEILSATVNRSKSLGSSDSDTIAAKIELGSLLAFRRGDLARSIPLLREACEELSQQVGADSGRTLYARLVLAGALNRFGKQDEALSILQVIRDPLRATYGDAHWAMVRFDTTLGATWMELNEYNRATTAFDSAIAHALAIDPALIGDRRVLVILARKGEAIRRAGNLDDAERIACEITDKLLDPDTGYWAFGRNIGQCYVLRGKVLMDRNRPDKAMIYFRLAAQSFQLELRTELDHPDRAECLMWMGKCLLAQANPAEASAYLKEASRIFALRFGESSACFRETSALLEQCLDANSSQVKPVVGFQSVEIEDIWLEAARAMLQQDLPDRARKWAAKIRLSWASKSPGARRLADVEQLERQLRVHSN